MDTIRVRRENVVLSILPHEKQDYMDRGFSVIDEKNKAVVFSGNLSKPVFSEEMGEYVRIADFSAFSLKGRFFICR